MRTFEFRNGTSAKFWSIDVKGTTVTTRSGRIGSAGRETETTFDTPAQAKAAANKQMADKLAADYRETGAKTKPIKLPAGKPVSKAKPAVSKVKPARVKQQKLPKNVDELFARGYPHLRRLAPLLRKGVPAAVEKALSARDPHFGVDVPEDVAHGFLSAMAFGEQKRAAVDGAMLDAFLERATTKLSDTSFRVRDAVWLFEAFLGTEVVAEAVAAHLVDIAKTNPNSHAFDLVDALGYMRWRMPSVRWTAITRPLQAVKTKGQFAERLMLLVDPTRPVPNALRDRAAEIALQRGDAATLRTLYNGGAFWDSARFAYLVGDEHFAKVDYAALAKLPAWQKRRIVEEYGLLHGPHIPKILDTLEAAI